MARAVRLAVRGGSKRAKEHQGDELSLRKKIHMNLQSAEEDAQLCPTLANKSLPANFTHGFDAAVMHQFLHRAEEQSIEVLTNRLLCVSPQQRGLDA